MCACLQLDLDWAFQLKDGIPQLTRQSLIPGRCGTQTQRKGPVGCVLPALPQCSLVFCCACLAHPSTHSLTAHYPTPPLPLPLPLSLSLVPRPCLCPPGGSVELTHENLFGDSQSLSVSLSSSDWRNPSADLGFQMSYTEPFYSKNTTRNVQVGVGVGCLVALLGVTLGLWEPRRYKGGM